VDNPEHKAYDPETLEIIEGLLNFLVQREKEIAELTSEVERLRALGKAAKPVGEKAPGKRTESGAVQAEGHSILVVDDNRLMRANLVQLFKANGYVVVGEAKDSQEAFNLNRLHHPDIVTLDTSMREMDGHEAIRRIKELNPEAKVIVISHDVEKQRILMAIKAGAAEYVLKPVQPERLLQVVKHLLAT